MSIERFQVAGAPTPAGPYSHAVAANGFLYTAGFGPTDPATGQLVGDEIEEQTRQVLRNVGTVLAAAGLGFGDVVKSTVHLADLHRDFEGFNRAYAEFFTQGYPVRTTVGSTLANILVEIDVVAALREPAE
ncbi:MAG: 2-iminobutanoate/2-iminopropanoate deaminase [Actinomycetota bacterium]|jgi:reactive intermediate/imine deaminase|nr:2-iminobutanoate/2-iminopropanoate deaminase [Actinomycetota bacterium]